MVSSAFKSLANRLSRNRPWQRRFLVLAGVTLFYTLIGFFLVPYLLKSELPKFAREELGHELNLGEVRFNPYSLTLDISDLELKQPNAPSLIRVGELFINFDFPEIGRLAWTFDEISLREPYINIEIDSSGDLNLLRLVPPGEPAASAEAAESDLPPLLFRSIKIEKGKVDFSDSTRPTPFKTVLDTLDIGFSELTTLPEDKGGHTIVAVSEQGETLRWSGTLSLQPLRSQGEISVNDLKMNSLWRYVRDLLNFEITDGSTGLKTDYLFHYDDSGVRFSLDQTHLDISGFSAVMPGETAPFIELARLSLEGGSYDLGDNRLAIGSIQLKQGDIHLWRDKKKRLNLQQLILFPDEGAEIEQTASPDAGITPFRFSVDRIEAADFDITYEERDLPRPARLKLSGLSLNIAGLSSREEKPFTFRLESGVGREGRLVATGEVAPFSPSVKAALTLDAFSLSTLQPYLEPFTGARLESGVASLQGDLFYQPQAKSPDLRFEGKGEILEFGLHTPDRNPLLEWKALQLAGARLTLFPGLLTIDELTFQEPGINLSVTPDGTNLESIVKQEASEAEPPSSEADAPSFPAQIKTIQFISGRIGFTDSTTSPPFSGQLQKLNGALSGFTNEKGRPLSIELNGQLNQVAQLNLKGDLDPMQPKGHTRLKLKLRDFEALELTPYSGKYVGYRIEKGKLGLDLDYHIEQSRLTAANNIALDHFDLGAPVEGAENLQNSLPLAIALLKGPGGRVDLDLPIRGDLDDPEFQLGPIVGKAFFGLIAGIVASPFKLIGKLVGLGGDDLEQVAFVPGSARLAPEEERKLTQLARALVQRPQLRLSIRGYYDPGLDARALRAVKAQGAILHKAKRPPETPFDLTQPEMRRALKTLFVLRYSPAALDDIKERLLEQSAVSSEKGKENGTQEGARLDESEFYAALYEAFVEGEAVEEEQLGALAQQRSRAIRDALLRNNELAAERVHLAGTGRGTPKMGKILARLELAVR